MMRENGRKPLIHWEDRVHPQRKGLGYGYRKQEMCNLQGIKPKEFSPAGKFWDGVEASLHPSLRNIYSLDLNFSLFHL